MARAPSPAPEWAGSGAFPWGTSPVRLQLPCWWNEDRSHLHGKGGKPVKAEGVGKQRKALPTETKPKRDQLEHQVRKGLSSYSGKASWKRSLRLLQGGKEQGSERASPGRRCFRDGVCALNQAWEIVLPDREGGCKRRRLMCG